MRTIDAPVSETLPFYRCQLKKIAYMSCGRRIANVKPISCVALIETIDQLVLVRLATPFDNLFTINARFSSNCNFLLTIFISLDNAKVELKL
jgi:hypothetical protein